MRLNYKTYPIYDILRNNAPIEGLRMDTTVLDHLRYWPTEVKTHLKAIKAISDVANKKGNHFYVTNTFYKAVEQARPKILDKNYWEELSPGAGLMLLDRGAVLYLLPEKDDPEGIRLMAYGFTREAANSFVYLWKNGDITGCYYRKQPDGSYANDILAVNNWAKSIMIMLYFIEHCEIETKELGYMQKLREHGERHFNETKHTVTMLDCSWFTELIRTTPTGVTGHYRWQACGEKFSKRKLIWIEGYEKQPMTRKAKKHNL